MKQSTIILLIQNPIHLIAVKQETKADHQSIAKTPQEPKPKYLNNTNHS